MTLATNYCVNYKGIAVLYRADMYETERWALVLRTSDHMISLLTHMTNICDYT